MINREMGQRARFARNAWTGVRCFAWFLFACSMPTGALGAEQRVFRVADFGAAGDGETDDRPAIQRAIDAAVKADGPAALRFESGRVYRLARHVPANGMLIVAGAEDLTLDGAGATLLCHPSNRILAIHASKRIEVRNFTLDYAPLPFTQGRMQTVDAEAGCIEFQPGAGYSAPVLGGEELYRDFKDSDCVFVRADGKFTHSWLRIRGITEPSPGLFRCTFHGANVAEQLHRTKAGDLIVVKMKHPQGETLRAPDGRFIATPVANINVSFSEQVLLEHITSYAAPGMTFNAHGSEAVVLDRCAAIRKPGTDRLVAGQSDGCHLKSLTVMPRILNCRFEALMDDSINVKISAERVEAIEGCRVLVAHNDIFYNDTVVDSGDEMEMYDPDNRTHLGFGKVIDVEPAGYRKAWLTFEKAPAGLGPGDLMYHRPVSPVEIRGVKFGSQLKTAILVRPPGTIADSTFDDVAYGVHAFVDGPIEGCMPREIRVQNCTFRHNTVSALALAVPSPQAPPPSRFTLDVRECRFVAGGNQGRLLSAYNVRGVSFRDSSVVIEDGRTLESLILTRNCSAVDLAGVRVE